MDEIKELTEEQLDGVVAGAGGWGVLGIISVSLSAASLVARIRTNKLLAGSIAR